MQLQKFYTFYIFFLVFIQTMTSFAFAQNESEVIVLKSTEEIYLIGNQLEVFEDKTAQLTFDQIITAETQSQFVESKEDVLNFGVTKSVIWVKFIVKNNVETQNDKWLASLTYPLFDYVNFYYQDKNNNWQEEKSGDMYTVESRAVKNRNFVFNLNLPQKQEKKYYLRFETQGSLQIALSISSELRFAKEEALDEIAHGLTFGFMFAMILYNLFVFFSLKDRNYLLYVIAMFVLTLLQMSYSGHLTYFILGDFPYISNISVPILMASANVFVAIFSMSFLSTYKYTPTAHKILSIFVLLNFLDVIAAFFVPTRISISFAGFSTLLYTIFIIFVGISIYRKGNKSARFFLLAWIFLLVGAVLTALRNFGLLTPTFLTIHGLRIGNVFEILLLSLSLSDRYNLFKKEKEKAQREALRIQKEANENLEQNVEERTLQLKEANQELQSQTEEIITQRDALEEAVESINEKNTQITASITYAQRIQEAMLPKTETIKTLLPNYFLLYRPRDIVSGDFYYFEEEQGKVIMAAIDCTGHGVPGAFMSMMGNVILDKIIKERKVLEVDEILNQMHDGVQNALKQNENKNRDGMDMSICIIDIDKNKVDFAGAKNPLYYIQNEELKIIKGDKFSVGGRSRKEKVSFQKHVIDISEPTQIYLFSDGYADEFGGEQGKKFMVGKFKKLLLEISSKESSEQKAILETTMDNWLGHKYRQIDDILVIGAKF